jgi:hypothetical protein
MGELGRPSNIQGQALIAAAAADGGFALGTGFSDGGCIDTVLHVPGSGLYAITLDPQQHPSENVVHVSIRVPNGVPTANVTANVEWPTPLLMNVRTYNAAGVLTDSAFDITITKARRFPA